MKSLTIPIALPSLFVAQRYPQSYYVRIILIVLTLIMTTIRVALIKLFTKN